MTQFSDLLGLTLAEIKTQPDERFEIEKVEFIVDDGRSFVQYHSQECCENVRVEEIHGDLSDLIGTPILLAEETEYDNTPDPDGNTGCDESYTWTFYKLATVKGHVTIRWLGESNGYYSESVYFKEGSR